MTWEEVLNERNGPLLQCFRKDGVVGVPESILNNAPRLIPLKTLNVDKNPEKLRNGEGWMSVVQLDRNLVVEFTPRLVRLLEPSNLQTKGA